MAACFLPLTLLVKGRFVAWMPVSPAMESARARSASIADRAALYLPFRDATSERSRASSASVANWLAFAV